MKRKDIEVGQEYLASGSADWATGHYSNQRVLVIDTGRWRESDYLGTGYGRKRSVTEFTYNGTTYPLAPRVERAVRQQTANCVLALRYIEGNSGQHAIAVLTQHIRAPWSEAEKVLEEYQEARRQQVQRQQREEYLRADRTGTIRERLRALGLPNEQISTVDSYGRLGMPAEVLESLLLLVESDRYDREQA